MDGKINVLTSHTMYIQTTTFIATCPHFTKGRKYLFVPLKKCKLEINLGCASPLKTSGKGLIVERKERL